ncbi:MAG: CHASE sensor domain-containing protein, partial [Steroidobacterales bacterium]
MMQWVGNLSLRAKLRVIVLYSAAAAVLAAGVLYAAGEVLAQRRQQAEQLLAMVKAVAENASFPLKQFNRASARNVLGALHADADIRAAALFDGAGNMVAAVDFDAQTESSAQRLSAWALDAAGANRQPIRFDGLTGADLQVPVTLDGNRLGTLHVDAELSGIYRHWPGSPESMMLGFLVALLVA